jgi:alkylated DNA nucleotide flippase Atl1
VQKISNNILKKCSAFDEKVYKEVLSIPCPFIIPCYRVIKSNGKCGSYIYGKKNKEKALRNKKRLT